MRDLNVGGHGDKVSIAALMSAEVWLDGQLKRELEEAPGLFARKMAKKFGVSVKAVRAEMSGIMDSPAPDLSQPKKWAYSTYDGPNCETIAVNCPTVVECPTFDSWCNTSQAPFCENPDETWYTPACNPMTSSGCTTIDPSLCPR